MVRPTDWQCLALAILPFLHGPPRPHDIPSAIDHMLRVEKVVGKLEQHLIYYTLKYILTLLGRREGD